MSAESPNPSGLPGRNRPHLSDLSRETTEEDLWNLDDETTAQPIQPRQPKPAPAPAAKEELPVLEGPSGSAAAPVPPVPRGLSPAVKRPNTRSAPDEIGDLDEEPQEPAPALQPKTQPADHVVTITIPTEDEPAPAPEVTSTPKTAATPDSPAAKDEAEVHEEALPGKSAPRENRPRSAAPAAKGSLPRPRLNRREVIGIATFAVVAMIASVWVLTRFFTLLSFTSDSDSKPSYPLKGELVQISAGSTFWREPIRTGENRDVARREVSIIPVVELTLDAGNSGGGSLRVIFRNAEGNPVGDAITRSFGAGRFEANGNATIGFAATDGFIEDGEFQAYRTGKGKLWTAEVLEGPPGGTPASAFKKLSSIPIFPERR